MSVNRISLHRGTSSMTEVCSETPGGKFPFPGRPNISLRSLRLERCHHIRPLLHTGLGVEVQRDSIVTSLSGAQRSKGVIFGIALFGLEDIWPVWSGDMLRVEGDWALSTGHLWTGKRVLTDMRNGARALCGSHLNLNVQHRESSGN